MKTKKTKKIVRLCDVTVLSPYEAEKLDTSPRRHLDGMTKAGAYQAGLEDAFDMARRRAREREEETAKEIRALQDGRSLIEAEMQSRVQALTDLLVVALKRPSVRE